MIKDDFTECCVEMKFAQSAPQLENLLAVNGKPLITSMVAKTDPSSESPTRKASRSGSGGSIQSGSGTLQARAAITITSAHSCTASRSFSLKRSFHARQNVDWFGSVLKPGF